MQHKIFAFTPTYGSRRFLRETVPQMRAKAAMDFDWGVWGGGLSLEAQQDVEGLLEADQIQVLHTWPENRGQHHAMAGALEHAREREYDWLLRIDDDVRARTLRWLKKMVSRCVDLQARTKDARRRLVAAPRMLRLLNPLKRVGDLQLGQDYPVDVMQLLGGMVRLHPMGMLDGFKPPLYAPKGRRDPDSIADHVDFKDGLQVRFPDIRVVHDTEKIEAQDSGGAAIQRRMGYYWPYLGEGV